ncbi:PREDICTED: zinc/RING finger protein 4-like [Dinoponera quadriceps]|uniref:Zinc/RING finger protein 4-like n=1 Tax=Dinoponera quadriceps TaxID=609295 RepID=A0A6P3WTX9_DINQU|nr:PREDICTED: zinc/RING finger protein 4-like [Dinoponera quadriceps]
MTYPGLVLLVGVGIGLATFLYYMFAENNSENDQRQQYNYADDRAPDHYDWGIQPTSSHSGKLNRRNLSNSSLKESGRERNHMRSEDINNCSICQYAIVGSDVIQLQPCRHNFHQDCIKQLRSYNPTAPCPNCRRFIARTT